MVSLVMVIGCKKYWMISVDFCIGVVIVNGVGNVATCLSLFSVLFPSRSLTPAVTEYGVGQISMMRLVMHYMTEDV